LLTGTEGRLAVVYGRRRVGKKRLLLEWTGRHSGLYTVADQSAPVVRALFVPEVAKGAPRTPHGVHVVRGAHLLAGIE